jgi:hypothetical protein
LSSLINIKHEKRDARKKQIFSQAKIQTSILVCLLAETISSHQPLINSIHNDEIYFIHYNPFIWSYRFIKSKFCYLVNMHINKMKEVAHIHYQDIKMYINSK